MRDSATDLSKPITSDQWTQCYGGTPSPVRALQSPVACKVAELSSTDQVLLEAGCGSATISAELATVGRSIHLLDYSQQILDQALELFRVSNLPQPSVTKCDLTRGIPLPDRCVDVAWNSGVLEHWTDEELVPIVREMARVSRESVIAFVPSAACVVYRLAKSLAEREGLWPYGRELPRLSLRSVFHQAGLSHVKEQRVWSEANGGFLHLTESTLASVVSEWWHSLPLDDPLHAEQGYLLVTSGRVVS